MSNDGIPEELKDIRAGQIDATVSQPADLYAKYGLYYAQAAIAGKTFTPARPTTTARSSRSAPACSRTSSALRWSPSPTWTTRAVG